MTVARILAAKGGDVVTIQPHRTIAEVARVLADRGIGAVIVAGADGDALGIISERDVVRAVARHGAGALNEAVTRYMTVKVATTTRQATVREVMEQMTEGRFRHVPVIENGRLAGVVSIGDVVKSHIEEIETEHRALREYIATA
jgi:signal-transduction protein with cAMP-binding, CBS, and nucleotidyltransferase domain